VVAVARFGWHREPDVRQLRPALDPEDHLAVLQPYPGPAPVRTFALDDAHGQRVLHLPRDFPAQGAGTVNRVEAPF
jgi:hypothetical protein